MNVTLDLTPELGRRLALAARQHGVPVDAYTMQLLDRPFQVTVRPERWCLFFSPGWMKRMAGNNRIPANTSFAHWTTIVCPTVGSSRRSRKASPGESNRCARRRATGSGDEPEAIAGERGLRSMATGTRCDRFARRSAGDRRLRSAARTAAGKPRGRTPTTRCTRVLIEYVPLTTDAMRQAAAFWAEARQRGRPTADDKALDGDVILAAQVATLESSNGVVATTNVGHLSRYVQAALWRDIPVHS